MIDEELDLDYVWSWPKNSEKLHRGCCTEPFGEQNSVEKEMCLKIILANWYKIYASCVSCKLSKKSIEAWVSLCVSFGHIKILWKLKVADSRKMYHSMETVNQLEFQIRSNFYLTSEGMNRWHSQQDFFFSPEEQNACWKSTAGLLPSCICRKSFCFFSGKKGWKREGGFCWRSRKS